MCDYVISFRSVVVIIIYATAKSKEIKEDIHWSPKNHQQLHCVDQIIIII